MWSSTISNKTNGLCPSFLLFVKARKVDEKRRYDLNNISSTRLDCSRSVNIGFPTELMSKRRVRRRWNSLKSMTTDFTRCECAAEKLAYFWKWSARTVRDDLCPSKCWRERRKPSKLDRNGDRTQRRDS